MPSPDLNTQSLDSDLAGLPLGSIRFFDQIDSTNLEAARWIAGGAPDLSLVVADEQTAGRGRLSRRWFTPPGASLAFSLVLRGGAQPTGSPEAGIDPGTVSMRLTALGALSISLALEADYGLSPEIKWPNDVLLQRQKTAGILVEGHWQGEQLQAAILGIGINIAPASVPPDEQISFPATCVEAALGRPVDRLHLLRAVIENLLTWRERLNEPLFITTWDRYLAFKREWVTVSQDGSPGGPASRTGILTGLDDLGRLRLKDRADQEFRIVSGELNLRPATNGSVGD
jgi:BirA family biotin operon repressor/biotin-[acetyl-CoA-carboxylase] ligase